MVILIYNLDEGLPMFFSPWKMRTVWKVSKYGVFSGPYFPVFSPNTEKYGPEKTAYLDTFHAVAFIAVVFTSPFNFTYHIFYFNQTSM